MTPTPPAIATRTVAYHADGGKTGHLPKFYHAPNSQEETVYLIGQIRKWRAEGIAWGDIAVLCHTKKQGEHFAQILREAGIPLQNPVSTEERKNYRPHPDYLLLCTIHSSKGGEFPCVIIAGIHTLPDKNDEERQKSARLLYVGMTRAQKYLHLTAEADNCFTTTLKEINK